MASQIYTGPLQTQNTSWLSNLNPANWFQQGPSTSQVLGTTYSQPQQPVLRPATVTPIQNTNYSSYNAVQGPLMQSGQFSSKSPYIGPVNKQVNTNTSTNDGGSTGTPTETTTDPNAELMNAINQAYDEQMRYVNSAEQNVRGQYPGVQSGINASYDTSVKNLAGEKGIAEGQLNQAGISAEQRKVDVVNAARRLFSELMMGGQQRFGGSSSAGQAYGELTGREFQRSQAGAEQGLTNTLQQIQQQKADLNTKHEMALGQLEQQKNAALEAAKSDFQNKLLQIDQMRASAGENKANLKLQALQDLRNQAFQIQLQSEQLKQSIAAQNTQDNSILDASINDYNGLASAGNQSYGSYVSSSTTDPLSPYSLSNIINPSSQATQYTGSIAPRRNPFDLLG